MNLKLSVAVFAGMLLSLSATEMRADTLTIFLGPSAENYSLIGQGGTGGAHPFGTYLAQQGSCAAGAVDTVCTLTGAYTGNTVGYSSGTYSLMTTYLNADGGLAATSTTTVDSPSGGNFFMFDPFKSDLSMSLFLTDVSGAKTIPVVVNGQLVSDSYSVNGVSPACANLPADVPCTQGNVGLNVGSSVFGPVTGRIIYTTPSAVPEPEWLALGGLIPGAFMMLRRRLTRTV